MEFEEVARQLQGVPHIQPSAARQLYDFIRTSKVGDVLELGFAHGASSAYMAAALQANGFGHITTMDLELAKTRRPDLVETLERTGLASFVTPVYAEATYTWELMKVLERQTRDGACRPCFDFVFIDGAHSWETDGLAFFLTEKLLRPGGWMLFDDLSWSYAASPSLRSQPFVRDMPAEMRDAQQVAKIFALLVAQHPNFDEARVEGDWGWAHKRSDAVGGSVAPTDVLDKVYGKSVALDAKMLARKVGRAIRARGHRTVDRKPQ
ncbi:MAG: hypothetical protein JWP02_3891 [Acidimicrobiales bacterium]|nr:hypothetical protein [Acidimicrobiales bacterium]